MTLIHVSLEPCIACVHHLRVIDRSGKLSAMCRGCAPQCALPSISLNVLVKARENNQLRLQHACVPRRSFKQLLCKIELSLLGCAATWQSAQVTSDLIPRCVSVRTVRTIQELCVNVTAFQKRGHILFIDGIGY